MKSLAVTLFPCLGAMGLMLALLIQPARALPEFKKEWDKKYLGDKSTDAQKKLATAAETAKCDICHDPTKKDESGMSSKKFRNAYGEALHKFVHKKDKKDTKKIIESLEKVEKMKASNGGTFGDQLKKGELPH